ncbi:MAG: hypothetical protein NTV86_16240 [Planctomycetota bacterium]|nr:hypothetical protein [Planctomycetota bacterium]
MRLALLCRWALLACLGGMAVWACIAAAVSIEREPPVVLSVSDGLYGVGARPAMGVIALWESATGPAELSQALAVQPAGHVRIMLPYGPRGCWFTMPPGGVSDRVFEVEGIPYGPLAFAQASGRFAVIPSGVRVYLVDAPLVHAALEADPADAAQLLGELVRRGVVACCDPGELGPFRGLRDQLRRLAPGVLATYTPPWDARLTGDLRAFPGLREQLRRLAPGVLTVDTRPLDASQTDERFLARPDARSVFFITARASLAGAAAEQGFVTYLVDPAATDTGAARLLTYPSAPALTRHLREDRIQLEELRRHATGPGDQSPSDATSVP